MLEIDGIAFKPRAYVFVAHSISNLSEDLKDIYKKGGREALLQISGVGQGIADKIEEYIKTGHIKEYEKLKKKLPVDIEGLMRVEGIGPKMVKRLYEEAGIKTVKGLEAAVIRGKLRGLPGIGQKTEENILKSLHYLEQSHGRFLLGDILLIARKIASRLEKLPRVQKVQYAGSLRRMQETIGDLDILVVSDKPDEVMDYFIHMSEVADVIAKGPTKTAVRLYIGTNADIRIVPPESFGAALQYFTGDKFHNVEVRKLAIKKGYMLNEYGLYRNDKLIAGKTEKEIYQALDMDWIEPELRTNSGEITAALTQHLPDLIGYDDLKGDLQTQTDWTDGEHSIREMAQAAQKHGLEYIAITDHTKALAMTGGSDEKKLLRQMAEIDKIQKDFPDFKILKGVEVDILKDGSLDIEDKVLEQLDVVGASIHSFFGMSQADMTRRIIRAMENPHVDILFHPTGRLIKKREPYNINMEAIIKTAKRTGTILEIDAYPDRLDLNDAHIRQAVKVGVKLAIDSDAHATTQFKVLEFGIAQARRGWAEKKDIINTRSYKEMLKLLK